MSATITNRLEKLRRKLTPPKEREQYLIVEHVYPNDDPAKEYMHELPGCRDAESTNYGADPVFMSAAEFAEFEKTHLVILVDFTEGEYAKE